MVVPEDTCVNTYLEEIKSKFQKKGKRSGKGKGRF
jgi:hypothetical protein